MATVNLKYSGNNLSGVREIPPGEYTLGIEAADVRKGKEYPFVHLEMVITDDSAAGIKVYDQLTTDPSTMSGSKTKNFKLCQLLKTIGYEMNPENESEIQFDTDDLVGAKVRAMLKKGDPSPTDGKCYLQVHYYIDNAEKAEKAETTTEKKSEPAKSVAKPKRAF